MGMKQKFNVAAAVSEERLESLQVKVGSTELSMKQIKTLLTPQERGLLLIDVIGNPSLTEGDVESLYDKDVDIDHVIHKRQMAVIRALVKSDIDLTVTDDDRRNPLIKAAQVDLTDAIRLIAPRTPEKAVNAEDRHNFTASHYTAKHANVAGAKALKAAGAKQLKHPQLGTPRDMAVNTRNKKLQAVF